MSIKNVIVVDTVGDPSLLYRGFAKCFPFVKEWHGHEQEETRGTTPHPHGGMCMSQVLLPLWDDSSGIIAHFVRVFDSSGQATSSDKWVRETITKIASTGPTWVNCSWGSYIGPSVASDSLSETQMWRNLIKDTGITVMWASGNSGNMRIDLDEESPQGALTDISFKVAAGTSEGRAADYSGDSTASPPIATFWSTQIRLLNPVNGFWEIGSGTSFAAPKACGLAAKRSLDYNGFKALAISSSTVPADYPGTLPHPKWGYGWMEEEYQKEIAKCPYTYDSLPKSRMTIRKPALEWFEFELVKPSRIKE